MKFDMNLVILCGVSMNIVMMFEVRNALETCQTMVQLLPIISLTNMMKILMDDFIVFEKNTTLEAHAYA